MFFFQAETPTKQAKTQKSSKSPKNPLGQKKTLQAKNHVWAKISA